ncbi:hypothetical protein ACQKWADRAFT_294717 [Trichoderma austrokoningii]
MARGDSIPRYTYTMDFNPLDEQSPLTDFWQMNDGFDAEDATIIASLATQALQAKLGYEYEDGIGVNAPAEVANYTESRSSPQSQYSAIVQEEPAESFRGLMEDHDRGAQFSGADVTSEYDMEPAARGRIPDHVAGFDEPAVFLREPNHHDTLYPLSNESAEADDMRGNMTASQIVNEVLRNHAELAAAQSQMEMNIQALHSQSTQLTPPNSESPSISAEDRDHRELEEDFLADVGEQHADGEPEDVMIEEPSLDIDAQQQIVVESDEQPTMDEDESRQPSPSPLTPRKAGRPRKRDTAVEQPDLAPKEPDVAEVAIREKVVIEGDEVVEPTVVDGAEIRDGETPAARRRGRPRKSETSEATRSSSTKRGPGRPPKLAAPEATNESTPATGKRGRPRKSEVEEPQAHTQESDIPIDEAPAATPAASKRGRSRKSEVEDQSGHTEKSDIPLREAPVATVLTGKRGRPRKSHVEGNLQLRTKESDIPAEETTAATVAVGKRGRPRKSDVEDESQAHTDKLAMPVEEVPATTPAANKRGRPRKSEAKDVSQMHTRESEIPLEASVAIPAIGKRGRPRKNEVEDKSLAHAEKFDIPTEETPTTAPGTGKRGRPRRNTLVDVMQAPDESQSPAVEKQSSTPSLSKRKRPRKSEVVDAAHDPTEEHTLTATEAASSTPVPGRRGRPRKSETMSITANLADESAFTATETAVSTPALGKRGRPPKSDAAQVSTNEPRPSIVETPTIMPVTGKRGRPRKSDAASAMAPETRAVPEFQAESEISTTADVLLPVTETAKQQNEPSRQDDALSTPSTQKRGRGRPPKSGVLVNTATDPEIAMDIGEAEPQGVMTGHMKDVAEDMAVDGNSGTEPAQENIEATPARKRGRPRSSATDKPFSMISAPVKALSKKRGRPPKALPTKESAKTLEEPTQTEAEETEERIAKRRRTDSDVVMEDSEEEPMEDSVEDLIEDLLRDPMEDPMENSQPEAREEWLTSVRKRRVSFAADTQAPKSLVPIRSLRRNSDSTGLKAGFFSIIPQRTPPLGGPTDKAKENAGVDVPQKITAAEQTELFLSRLPRPTVKSVFEGKFGKRPKTYGKRVKK